MRWRGRRQSENVVDRRGERRGHRFGRRVVTGRRASFGGGVMGLLLLLLFVYLGGDPAVFLQQGGDVRPDVAVRPASPADDSVVAFVKVVLADTEDVWEALFPRQLGSDYSKPQLHLFSDGIDSACGFASSAVGPFYCPADRTVYLDTDFFQQLHSQLGAPGDFAMAYVIAHEVAHHVQNELGTTGEVHRAQRGVSKRDANQLSVRLELQADYLAGVWAHHAQQTKRILEPGDVEEAMRAANAIGDDRLQKSGRGYVVPDSFTHGTSAQRVRWFRRGLETGDVRGMSALFQLNYEAL